MHKLVGDAGVLTLPRKQMFAGMYFQAAERVAGRVSRKEARRLWRACFAADLITPTQLRQGIFYLYLMRFAHVAAAFRKRLEKHWPQHYFVRRTETYLKTPLPAAKVVA